MLYRGGMNEHEMGSDSLVHLACLYYPSLEVVASWESILLMQ